MGMCSRQERIQKDVDIVIQSCKAEKDCLFSDFRYTDATFTFTYCKGAKRVSYSVHVSDDYPDNTYVSNSENDDEVLITTDPIPVIFHRIATEIRLNNDAISCLSTKSRLQLDKTQCHYTLDEDSEGDNDSEEFYYGGQVNYDGELHKHPQLEADLQAVRDLYGPHAVSLREYGAIDDVDIDLHIDVSFLDTIFKRPLRESNSDEEEIALAWDVIRREPVIIRLHCSLTQYLNGTVPTVDVFQVSTKDRFGLGHQLKKIMQTFVTQQWKHQSKEKLNCPHSKKQNDKKVKSPLHLFSNLRRSPSYPPPGCVKSKKKLKPEQDGVSKSHRLLRRTCSSTVKQPEVDGCGPGPSKSAHKLLGHAMTGDARVEHAPPLPLKPHRLLGRPCSSAVKPEDCPSALRPPHKGSAMALPRSCSGDPRCDHPGGGGVGVGGISGGVTTNLGVAGGGLKPHRLLSRSCSGTIRTEEMDGLKHHHRLLSRSYSSSTKMGKADIFKDPAPEGRRLSLTSGLIGILAPSLATPPAPNNGAKSIPIRDKGFLVQTMEYAEQRIPVLNEFCVVCDEPHVFQNGPMLRPTVCERELCVFAFQTLGVMNEAADEIATGAQYKMPRNERIQKQTMNELQETAKGSGFMSRWLITSSTGEDNESSSDEEMEERELIEGVSEGQSAQEATDTHAVVEGDPEVVDLLVSMCRSALESPRKVVIFEPYPSVVDPNDSQTLAFNPRKKDYDRVMRALDSLTSIREMTQAPYFEIKKQMDKHDPLAHPLLQWVISSNRSHIVKLPVTRQLKFMHTPHQFLLLSSPPAKESNFRAAKNLFGSTFAFHGSHIENWHSILRNGLVVASNTRLQLHGAIYGNGIYLSPLSSISFGYSGMNKKHQKVTSKDDTATSSKTNLHLQSQKKGQQPQFLQSRNLKCIALCEVITSPDLHKHGDIWVVPNTDHVCTRFFFVYEDGQVGDTSINTQDPSIHREILRVIGNQTATG